MKIFWSWQSDTPGKTGRFLVRDAIRDAIDRLKQSAEIDEPTDLQRLDSLHLDQDRQGLPGSPDLAQAIFQKIDAASVVVADVTIVSRGKRRKGPTGKPVKGRAFINPNVGIEVGYAIRAVGDANLLLVVNAHYGGTEDLPFDLRHKAVSLVYSLADDADKAEIDSAKRSLTATFVKALPHYFNSPPTPNEALEVIKQPAKVAPAFFFSEGETLARIGEPDNDEIEFSMQTDKALYLRLAPTRRRSRPFTPRELSEHAGALGNLWLRHDLGLQAANEYGHIIFRPDRPHGPDIVALTQVFFTGEIWGVNRHFMRFNEDFKRNIIPSLPFEQTYFDTMQRYLEYLQRIGCQPPFAFEAGLAGCNNHWLARDYGLALGPIRQNKIEFDYLLRDVTELTVHDCLLKFFEHLYNHTPNARPDRDWGFPPGPPSYEAR